MDLNIVILAGGHGTRLWPLTSGDKPKPLLQFFDQKTMLEETIDRFSPLGQVFVLMPKDLIKKAQETIPEGKCEYIEEPFAAGTAVAIRYAADQFMGKEKVLFTPADQVITNVFNLHKQVQDSLNLVDEGNIAIFGAEADRPCDQYGYITFTEDGSFDCFIEKPSKEEAAHLIKQGAIWHMGIDMMRVDTLIEAWDRYYVPGEASFEQAVLSKIKDIKGVKVETDFKDLGTFTSFFEHFEDGDYKQKSNWVYSKNIPVRIEGINDLMVVATSEGILIRKK